MSVTPPVSQVEMWPYAASAAALSESQRATAVLMLSLSSALPATAGTKLATHRSAAGFIVVAQGQPYHGAAARRGKSCSKYGLELAGPVRNVLREEEASEGETSRGPLETGQPTREDSAGQKASASGRAARAARQEKRPRTL